MKIPAIVCRRVALRLYSIFIINSADRWHLIQADIAITTGNTEIGMTISMQKQWSGRQITSASKHEARAIKRAFDVHEIHHLRLECNLRRI